MIVIALLIIIGLYLILFVVVGFKATKWSSRLGGWAILISPLIWETWDIPVGYYRFKKLCEAEAGLYINVPNPVPAKIIRLESYFYTADHAKNILINRPSVMAVEAKDKKYDYLSKPVAFAWYERSSDENIVSWLVDTVGKPSGKGEIQVIKSAPSKADYIFTEKLDYPGDRMSREIQELRHRDGTVIGSSTSLDYMWSNPANSFLANSIHTSRCGPPMATSDREYNKLLDLISLSTK